MMFNAIIVLDHLISSKGIHVDPTKVEVITHLRVPRSEKEVRIFLGHACYYRRVITSLLPYFSYILNILTSLRLTLSNVILRN